MTSAILPLVFILFVTVSTFAQGLAPSNPDLKPDNRPAQALYEDANGYLGRKYQEFNKQKLPYDPKLEAQTKKEQKELAVKNAATLQARSHLSEEDVYYLGLLQHLGIGSVVYVFALAFLLWAFVYPLKPKNWSYFTVVTFVALVSPPAILYAIPVEKLFSFETAVLINVWFLAIVALWRVALLIYFLRVVGRLEVGSVLVASLLPLTLVVVALTWLNLEKAVFALMAGLSERTPTANDGTFAVLQWLSLFAVLLFVPLLVFYLVLIVLNRTTKQSDAESTRELG